MWSALLLTAKVILTLAQALIAVWGLGTEKLDSYGNANPKRKWVIASLVLVTFMQPSIAGFEWYDKREADRKSVELAESQAASLKHILSSTNDNLAASSQSLKLAGRALASANRNVYPFKGKVDFGFLLPAELLNDPSHADFKRKLNELTTDIQKQGRGRTACDSLPDSIASCVYADGSKEYIIYNKSSYFTTLHDTLLTDLRSIRLSLTVQLPKKDYSPSFERTKNVRLGSPAEFLEFPYQISFHINDALDTVVVLIHDIDLEFPGLSVADLSDGQLKVLFAIEGRMGYVGNLYPVQPKVAYFNTRFNYMLNFSLDREGVSVRREYAETILSFSPDFELSFPPTGGWTVETVSENRGSEDYSVPIVGKAAFQRTPKKQE